MGSPWEYLFHMLSADERNAGELLSAVKEAIARGMNVADICVVCGSPESELGRSIGGGHYLAVGPRDAISVAPHLEPLMKSDVLVIVVDTEDQCDVIGAVANFTRAGSALVVCPPVPGAQWVAFLSGEVTP